MITLFLDPNYSHVSMNVYPWNLIKGYIPGVQYVTISPIRNKQLCKLYNVSSKKIPIINNGIDAGDFLNLQQETEDLITKYNLLNLDYFFLAPSRIVRRKNLELVIRINAAIKHMFKVKSKVVITGPPDPHNIDSMDYFNFLKEVAKREKSVNDTIFLYDHFVSKKKRLFVSKKIIRDLYFLADGLLFPSFQEGFGIPVLEAGITKRPVICSIIPPLMTIGGDDVLKVDPQGDPEMIAKKTIEFLARDSTRPLFKKVVHEYYWVNIFERDILPLINN